MHSDASLTQNAGSRRALDGRVELEPDFRQLFDFGGGRHAVTLALGGIPFLALTDDDGIAGFLTDVFRPFLSQQEPRVTLDLRRTEKFPFRTEINTWLTYRQGDFLAAKFRDMAAYVDAGSRHAKGWIRSEHYRQDLLNVIRFVVGAVAPGLEALLFHTAGVAHRGRAWLFFGPSEAGKSTITRLSLPREVLTDDMLVLRHTSSGLKAASCGFWGGQTRDLPTLRLELPVAGFFRLKKGDSNRLVPMDRVTQAFEIACNTPTVERNPSEHRLVLDLATRAADSAPGYELYFNKTDDSFWRCLDELA